MLTETVVNGLNDLAGATGYILLGICILYTVFSVAKHKFSK